MLPPEPRAEPTAIISVHGQFTSTEFRGMDPLTYHIARAEYFSQRRDLARSIAEYQLAAEQPAPSGTPRNYVNFVARMPLSALLYRTGNVRDARTQWATILHDRMAQAEREGWRLPQPSTVTLLAQRRLDLLSRRAVPNWNPGFQDSGAGQHMEIGADLAAKREYAAAAKEWRISARCSSDFEPPHLMLGYYAFLQGDRRTARSEWIAVLEGRDPAPGDMLGITSWQYDAIAALLRYTL